jgi:hypothetical protein
MYEVVVSLVGLALLLSVLVFDCRVRVEATKSAEASHFSARLLQQACAALSSASSSVSRRLLISARAASITATQTLLAPVKFDGFVVGLGYSVCRLFHCVDHRARQKCGDGMLGPSGSIRP